MLIPFICQVKEREEMRNAESAAEPEISRSAALPPLQEAGPQGFEP